MSSKHLYESVVDSESVATHRKGPRRHPRIFFPALFAFCTFIGGLSLYGSQLSVSGPRGNGEFDDRRIQHPPFHAQRILSKCAALKASVGPPDAFSARKVSDRFEPGTNSTLIRNANIWTGARNGTETVVGDVLLEGGVVKKIGYIPRALLVNVHNLTVVEANGAWITPGLGEYSSREEAHLNLIDPCVFASGFAFPYGTDCCTLRDFRAQLPSRAGRSLATKHRRHSHARRRVRASRRWWCHKCSNPTRERKRDWYANTHVLSLFLKPDTVFITQLVKPL